MKLALFIVFLIIGIYFKANNTLSKLSILKTVFTSNYIVNCLIFLIIAVALSSYIGGLFKNKNSVSADELMEEFTFVTDVRNVTTSGKIKQKELFDEFKQKLESSLKQKNRSPFLATLSAHYSQNFKIDDPYNFCPSPLGFVCHDQIPELIANNHHLIISNIIIIFVLFFDSMFIIIYPLQHYY